MQEQWIHHYRIETELGRGGMGIVYRVWDSKIDRVVALKLLLTTSPSSEAMKRFCREAQVVARLRHPNIVTVYDINSFKDNYPYYTMELIEEGSLKQYLKSQPLSWQEKASLMIEICEALHYVHEQGIFHRDLKPANILLDKGRVKIADFGLAKVADSPEKISKTGQMMGTLQYMSPEQARGNHSETSAETDVYALGVIFYEMLAGQLPFDTASNVSLLAKILMEEPPHPLSIRGDIPPALAEIALCAMNKEKSQRYPSAQHMAEEIKQCRSQWQELATENTEVPSSLFPQPSSSFEQTEKTEKLSAFHSRSNKATALLCSLLVVLVLCGGWLGYSLFFSASSVPPTLLYQQQQLTSQSSHFMTTQESLQVQVPAEHFLYLIRKQDEQAWPDADFFIPAQPKEQQLEISPKNFIQNQSWFLVTSYQSLSQSRLNQISSLLGKGERAIKPFVPRTDESSQLLHWKIYHLSPHKPKQAKLLADLSVSEHPLSFTTWLKKPLEKTFHPLPQGGTVQENDQLQLRAKAYRKDIYLVVFIKDRQGKISQLYPFANKPQRVSSSNKMYIPAKDQGFVFDKSIGEELIVYFYDNKEMQPQQLQQWLASLSIDKITSYAKRGIVEAAGQPVTVPAYGTHLLEHQ